MLKSNVEFSKWLDEKIEGKPDGNTDFDPKPKKLENPPDYKVTGGMTEGVCVEKSKDPPTYEQAKLTIEREKLWKRMAGLRKRKTPKSRKELTAKATRAARKSKRIAMTSGNNRDLPTIEELEEDEEDGKMEEKTGEPKLDHHQKDHKDCGVL